MSNIFTRIKDTISADFNEMLDQKEQKNPIAQLNQYVRQCEQEVKKIRGLVEKQYTLKQEFTKEYHQAAAMADKRKRQADIAKNADELELYEQAKEEQTYFEERAAKLDTIRQNAVKELESLEGKYVQMKHKLKDLYVKRMELKGRENVARAHKGMNQVLHAELDSERSASRFADMENYIERLENQVNSDYRVYTLDARMAELEKRSEKI
ncbi:PspA/IM30 family protein [Sediminibacillus albus]|uniref:Phage shock protein A n=1 Tax=Sediminibacillus albus TaxID=407036 RepID=A0A1G8ZTH3_9BACI|nr:PspA/IM30 family protein [Sediminibacillus albus]SDK17904.1 Phage shock protein A [Sediminibacillus albus]